MHRLVGEERPKGARLFRGPFRAEVVDSADPDRIGDSKEELRLMLEASLFVDRFVTRTGIEVGTSVY